MAWTPSAADASPPSREVVIPFMVSGMCHLAVLAFMMVSPALAPRTPAPPPAIHVRMVALPETTVKKVPAPAPRTQAATRVRQAPVRRPAPPPDAVSIAPPKQAPAPQAPAPAVREKTSLKRKTFQSERVMDRAIERIEKDVEETTPDQIDAAIERLQAQIKEPPAPEPDAQDAVRNLDVDGAARQQDAKALELIDIYRVEIAFIVQKNWAFSESLAGDATDLVTEIAFDVLPGGTISDIWFDKRSGNGYLDESARKAIIKSVPLPPHPAGVIRPAITVGLRFTPQGVR